MSGEGTETSPMIRRFLILSLSVTGLFLSAQGQSARDKWDAADLQTVRLAPSAFPQLSMNIAQALEKRGCRVPQSFANLKPHNVIRGEFARKGQADWAVLCSLARESSILIFWGGSAVDPAEIAKERDKNQLQSIDGQGTIGFSRAISPAGKDFIDKHYQASADSGAPQPPPIDHQGINDAVLGKASTVHYYYAGKWLELAGSD